MDAYICQLPNLVQLSICMDLSNVGICGDDLTRAMEGRLCDLEDVIDIAKYL